MISNKKIVLFTMSLWNEPRRGRHHFAKALSEDNLVIWVNRQLFPNESGDIRVGPEYINQNLIILHTGASIFSQRIDEYLNINNRTRLKHLIKFLGKHGEPDILWAYDYKSINVVKYYKRALSLYYCNDFFGEKVFWYYEKQLARAVNHVICTDPRLAEQFKPINKSSHFISHGLWPHLNRRQFCKKKLPRSLGYVGTLNGTVDIDFFERILNETDFEIYIAGPIVECDDLKKIRFENLLKKNRVFYFGIVGQDEINMVLSSVDVCLLPYIKSFNGFALKFFDYINNAKPIIATKYDFIWPENYEEFVHIYSDGINLKEFIFTVYENWNIEKYELQIKLAENSTWKDRAAEVSRCIGL